jgi:hypothetical protein
MKSIQLLVKLWLPIVAGLSLAVAGCSGSAPPTSLDATQAREALRLSLETWQKGAAPGSLKERQPPIHVVDHQWRGGYQLVRYQLGSDGPVGASLRCQAQLSLKDTKGKTLRKKAVFSVGTNPVLTIHREEDP